VQTRRVRYLPPRREGSRVEVFGKWYFATALLVLSFMCVVVIVVCVLMVAIAGEMNKGLATPTPAAEPASWSGVATHVAGDPRPFELIM